MSGRDSATPFISVKCRVIYATTRAWISGLMIYTILIPCWVQLRKTSPIQLATPRLSWWQQSMMFLKIFTGKQWRTHTPGPRAVFMRWLKMSVVTFSKQLSLSHNQLEMVHFLEILLFINVTLSSLLFTQSNLARTLWLRS